MTNKLTFGKCVVITFILAVMLDHLMGSTIGGL